MAVLSLSPRVAESRKPQQRALIPFVRAPPSSPNYWKEAPPLNITTLGVRISTYEWEWWRGLKSSVPNTGLFFFFLRNMVMVMELLIGTICGWILFCFVFWSLTVCTYLTGKFGPFIIVIDIIGFISTILLFMPSICHTWFELNIFFFHFFFPLLVWKIYIILYWLPLKSKCILKEI